MHTQPAPPPGMAPTCDHGTHCAQARAAVCLLRLKHGLDGLKKEKVQACPQAQADHRRLGALPQRAHPALQGDEGSRSSMAWAWVGRQRATPLHTGQRRRRWVKRKQRRSSTLQ